MPESHPPASPVSESTAKPITAPLSLWLIAQLLALALAAARVPLSAHFVQPGEALAVQELLVAQFALSAMTLPFLLRDVRCCVAMILTSAPMLQLAGVLAATSAGRIVGAWTCLALWLAALSIWRNVLAPNRRPFAVAIANLLTLGGLMIWSLSTESHGGSSIARVFPLVATMRFAGGNEQFSLPLCSTAALAISGVIAMWMTRRCTSRRA